jgi:hypothetical protein
MAITERVGASSRATVEEIHIRRPGVYVSLVVNRRQRVARVVDFLAGNFLAKMQAIDERALKEGIERVYTLVEREESLGWLKVGYAREGAIPAYYKRSDAYLMGHLVSANPVLTEEGVPEAPVADVARAEKTLVQAKKLAMELPQARGARTERLDDTLAAIRWNGGRARRPSWLDERFGRTGTRFHVSARPPRVGGKGNEQVVSVELQETFGNAYLQPAVFPNKAEDAGLLSVALAALDDELTAREVSCVFGLSPADNVPTAAAFLAAGYKRTGLLAKHLAGEKRRMDALLWTRRPAGA